MDTNVMSVRQPLVSTYSIVAVSPGEGLMGVAVQSHFLAVGAIVPWARAGIGAVATQALANPDFGPAGLDRLAAGEDPAAIVDALTAGDASPEVRQFSVLRPDGVTATHTGHRCIAYAGHVRGAGYSVQANMMDHPGVPEAMAAAWEESSDTFPERLLAVLRAAEAAGGDVRGRQSAAILVTATEPSGHVLADRPLDLRVEDHPEPLEELERLLTLHRAYELLETGDEAAAQHDWEAAANAYDRARDMVPEQPELTFWGAVSRAATDPKGARDLLASLGDIPGGQWWRCAVRLPRTGLFPHDSSTWDAVLAPRPGLVYHIGSADTSDSLAPASLETEGFVHCSYAHQLPDVIDRFYPDRPDPEVLAIDPERAAAAGVRMVVEDSYGHGEAFPHLYGAIPPEAVVDRGPLSQIVPGLR